MKLAGRKTSSNFRTRRSSVIMTQSLKKLSFGDGYRLGLIAKNPNGIDRLEVVKYLDSEAEKIGRAIITPKKASKNARSAAIDLLKLADKKA